MENLWKHTEKGTEILTGIGRIVAGDCLKPQDKDNEGRPLTIKSGPNAGQPRVQYYLGLAIPKTDPSWPAIQAAIITEAKHGFPQLFDTGGNCIAPKFAFKFVDGDDTTPNTKGVSPSSREGYPGHFIINCSNGFAPKCYKRGPLGLEAVTDPETIKRGYYARIYGTVKSNGSVQNPGVFINTSMILMERVGDEIFSGPAAEDVFGVAQASVTPPVTTPVPPPITPNPAFAQGPEKFYTIQGVDYTHQQLLSAGWTEEQIGTLS